MVNFPVLTKLDESNPENACKYTYIKKNKKCILFSTVGFTKASGSYQVLFVAVSSIKEMVR